MNEYRITYCGYQNEIATVTLPGLNWEDAIHSLVEIEQEIAHSLGRGEYTLDILRITGGFRRRLRHPWHMTLRRMTDVPAGLNRYYFPTYQ